MTELDLEAIRRKAANPVTATDAEWASIVNDLLDKVDDLQGEVQSLEWDLEQEAYRYTE